MKARDVISSAMGRPVIRNDERRARHFAARVDATSCRIGSIVIARFDSRMTTTIRNELGRRSSRAAKVLLLVACGACTAAPRAPLGESPTEVRSNLTQAPSRERPRS
jgi:hypothetical protein